MKREDDTYCLARVQLDLTDALNSASLLSTIPREMVTRAINQSLGIVRDLLDDYAAQADRVRNPSRRGRSD